MIYPTFLRLLTVVGCVDARLISNEGPFESDLVLYTKFMTFMPSFLCSDQYAPCCPVPVCGPVGCGLEFALCPLYPHFLGAVALSFLVSNGGLAGPLSAYHWSSRVHGIPSCLTQAASTSNLRSVFDFFIFPTFLFHPAPASGSRPGSHRAGSNFCDLKDSWRASRELAICFAIKYYVLIISIQRTSWLACLVWHGEVMGNG